MRRFTRYIVALLCALLSLQAMGQQLPALKSSNAIHRGALPNGVSYYLVPNTTSKGYANFALVQKRGTDTAPSRRLLRRLPHFTEVSPYQFEASKGVGYGPEGYLSYPDGATLFNFRNVPTFDSAAADSTLLLVFDLVDSFDGPQSIIISGDISLNSIVDKMKVLSLTIGARKDTGHPAKAYSWEPSGSLVFESGRNSTASVAGVTLSWSSPRTPPEAMNTPQPLVSRMYAAELGYIARKRIERTFRSWSIPLADIDIRYKDSAASSGDESFSFTIYTGVDYLQRAVDAMAVVFAELDTQGVVSAEFKDAMGWARTEDDLLVGSPVSNAEYVDKCVSHYLLGASLASRKDISAFFAGRQLPAARELGLFNGFVKALLDPQKALTLRVDTPSGTVDREEMLTVFSDGWKKGMSASQELSQYKVNVGDTLGLFVPVAGKVKIKSTAVDPVSGGSVWTFSNGMKVIFKKTSGSAPLYYAFMLKGGYSHVPDLGEGESAFVGDMMEMYNIGGRKPWNFRNMMEANGISLETKVSITDMRMQGRVPEGKLPLLLRSLLTFSSGRTVSEEAFSYYRKCEVLREERTRLSVDGINDAIDSIMSPTYYYPATKSISKLRDDLPQRVEQYLRTQFAKADDGALVIIGNTDERKLKKLLCSYLGNFRTGDGFSLRPKTDYELRKGWFTYSIDANKSSVGGGETCVSMGLAAERQFTMESYSAFMIAAVALKNAVVNELAGKGYYPRTLTDVRLFPTEQVAIFINCRPCEESGLPAGISPADPMETLRAVRVAVMEVARDGISAAELKGYKEELLNRMENQYSQSEGLVDAILMRDAEGKDIVSNYQQYIKAVTLEGVRSALRDLDMGSKVEYVIK